MLQPEKQVRVITLILGIIAGYCDTVTFTSANGLLSAHVTGNFILFAGKLVNGSDLAGWARLLTFPVFVLSVVAGSWLSKRQVSGRFLLFIEALVLCGAGIAAVLLRLNSTLYYDAAIYPVALAVVFAMGLQNTYGRVFNTEVFGPTTVMTGNVTQWSIDASRMIWSGKPGRGGGSTRDPQIIGRLKQQSLLIAAFFIGCLAGAMVSRFIGLGAILPAGVTLLMYHMIRKHDPGR